MGALSSWLSGFTESTRSLLPFARAAVSEGIGRTEFYNITRAAGIGARKTDVLRMMRDLETAYKSPSTYLDLTNEHTLPIAELIPQSLGQQARHYSYLISGDRYDPETNTTVQVHVTIASGTLITQSDAKSYAQELINEYPFQSDTSHETLKIVSITRSDSPIFRT